MSLVAARSLRHPRGSSPCWAHNLWVSRGLKWPRSPSGSRTGIWTSTSRGTRRKTSGRAGRRATERRGKGDGWRETTTTQHTGARAWMGWCVQGGLEPRCDTMCINEQRSVCSVLSVVHVHVRDSVHVVHRVRSGNLIDRHHQVFQKRIMVDLGLLKSGKVELRTRSIRETWDNFLGYIAKRCSWVEQVDHKFERRNTVLKGNHKDACCKFTCKKYYFLGTTRIFAFWPISVPQLAPLQWQNELNKNQEKNESQPNRDLWWIWPRERLRSCLLQLHQTWGGLRMGFQDPWKSVASDDRSGKPEKPSPPGNSKEDYGRSWSSQEWSCGARSIREETTSWDIMATSCPSSWRTSSRRKSWWIGETWDSESPRRGKFRNFRHGQWRSRICEQSKRPSAK